jgi:hypothetical protein
VQNTPLTILVRTLPGHLLYNVAAALHFARRGLIGPFLSAKIAAIRGLPRALRKRARVQQARTAPSRAIWDQLEPKWLALKMREKRFDADLAEQPR